MPAKLFCKTGQLAGASFEIEKSATIGTKSANDIVLYPKIISGKHARIIFDEESKRYFLEDLKSRNGTKLDGEILTGKEKLNRLHVITFANSFDFIFQVVDSLEKPVEKTISDDNVRPIPDLTGGSKQKEQVVREDAHKTLPEAGFANIPEIPKEQKTSVYDQAKQAPEVAFFLKIETFDEVIELKDGENIIGRAIESDICIDDPSISRQHACLKVKSDVVKIKDFGSKNHTYVANEKINSEIKVEEGAEIRFGEVNAKLILKK